tara:strand:- start:2921 stop:3448 length:528 start_codon:yes stop_codon:yes gene_type:complete
MSEVDKMIFVLHIRTNIKRYDSEERILQLEFNGYNTKHFPENLHQHFQYVLQDGCSFVFKDTKSNLEVQKKLCSMLRTIFPNPYWFLKENEEFWYVNFRNTFVNLRELFFANGYVCNSDSEFLKMNESINARYKLEYEYAVEEMEKSEEEADKDAMHEIDNLKNERKFGFIFYKP